MLGDQLIKNESIALIELIKNSYDADASWVRVTFEGFGKKFETTQESRIIIEDNGCGMDANILKKHWLNPATPDKLKQKKAKKTTQRGRIIQGEKGIGRFAIFKLGDSIKIITRRQQQNIEGQYIDEGASEENTLIYDFARYDDNFLSENGKERELFIDDLDVVLLTSSPKIIITKEVKINGQTIVRPPYGTRIEICGIKSRWTYERIVKIQEEVAKLQPIFVNIGTPDFQVSFEGDGIDPIDQSGNDLLLNYIDNKSVFRITKGNYYNTAKVLSFLLNGKEQEISLNGNELKGLKGFYPERFSNPNYKTECGDFSFNFYIFDFNADSQNPSKIFLDSAQKTLIKGHRIYLYRDGIRVMPYGDPEDDWLGIDVTRGTIRASKFLSNDQVVGYISISQQDNTSLKDKTNREGLIEEGEAYSDFVTILRLLLGYIRAVWFEQYLIEKRKKHEIEMMKRGRPNEIIQDFKHKYSSDSKAIALLSSLEKSYTMEKQVLQDRILKTENLAAVGLSVETASHDIMLLIHRTLEKQDSLIRAAMNNATIEKDDLINQMTLIRGSLSMIQTQLKDIQLLFPSTRNRTKKIDIVDIIKKVNQIYERVLRDNLIEVDIISTRRPLIVKTTDAVLLQVFINLFDNSLYWLKTVNTKRTIKITIDGDNLRLLFSDSGPGIKDSDASYIFEAFYSGKGEDGRGLGLYIARQLLDRYDYSISLAEFSKDKQLSGANFVLEFITSE